MDWRNFRDVASLEGLRDLGMRPGLLYRSAAYHELPDHVIEDRVRSLGIRRIFDLRMVEEFADAECDTGRFCERLHVPLFETRPPDLPEPFERTPEEISSLYLVFAEAGGRQLVRIIDTIASEPAVPTLVHCVAGRDRTGIVIACALDLLGADEEAIGADYAISRVMDDGEGRNASPLNIQLFLDKVRQKYGSVEEFLARFGGSPDAADRLRRTLLDHGPAAGDQGRAR